MKKTLMVLGAVIALSGFSSAQADAPPDFKISGILNVIEQGNVDAKLTFTSEEDGLVLKNIRASSPQCLVKVESDDVVPSFPIRMDKGQSINVTFVGCQSLANADAINVAGNVAWVFSGK